MSGGSLSGAARLPARSVGSSGRRADDPYGGTRGPRPPWAVVLRLPGERDGGRGLDPGRSAPDVAASTALRMREDLQEARTGA